MNGQMHAPRNVSLKISKRGGVLPEMLIGRKSLDDLRTRITEQKIQINETEPDWAALRDSFETEYALDAHHADEMVRALERLWLLPSFGYENCAPFIKFLFASLPKIEVRLQKKKDEEGLVLAMAYRVMTEMLLQGGALFPVRTHYVANYLLLALESPASETRSTIMPFARLLAAAEDGVCGNNRYIAEQANTVAIHEHLSDERRFDGAIANSYKFDSYTQKLKENERFWTEWASLKNDSAAHDFWGASGTIQRSGLQENNMQCRWRPHFRSIEQRFQSTFDLFCWKWFLFGMQRGKDGGRDEPLVEKLTYSIGPHGTTMFIPGYWSIDLHRDFELREITRLHKARGVARQGEKLDQNRTEFLEQARRVQAANHKAKQMSLHGEKRFRFLKEKASLDFRTDDAHIRRLLRVKFNNQPDNL